MSLLRSPSLSTKIVGIVAVLLAMMAAAAIYSYVQIQSVREEVLDVTVHLDSVEDALSLVTLRKLEKSNYYQRALRNLEAWALNRTTSERPATGPEIADEDVERFEELGEELSAKILAARETVDQALGEVTDKDDAVALARLEPILEMVGKDHGRAHELALELLGYLREKDVAAYRIHEPRLEREMDSLDATLLSALARLEAFGEKQDVQVRGQGNRLLLLSQQNLWLAIGAFFLGLILASLIAWRLVRPIRDLTTNAERITAGDLDVDVEVHTKDEVGALAAAFKEMVLGLQDRERLKATFSTYLDPRVVKHVLNPASTDLQGDRRTVTVFFSDIVDFTPISEHLTPPSLVRLINAYLSAMSKPIQAEGGVIDKYIGDSIMAWWGAPFVAEEEQALRACRAALSSIEGLPRFQEGVPDITGLRTGAPSIDIRIGIATGQALVGNLGSDSAKNFTVMGDAVNLGSRLEGACKLYGVRCLVSDTVREQVGRALAFREIDCIAVKGKTESVRVFEPLAEEDALGSERLHSRDRFEEGLAAYRARRWDDAAKTFQEVLETQPDDGPSRVFLERIEVFRESPPDDDWNGVCHMTTK